MRVMIAAGGTGGHLYPGVALAQEFLRQNPAAAVRFVGTARGIESKVLPHEGFELDLITALPFMGLGLRKAASAVLALPIGLRQSIRLLRRHRAELVVGIGGYTTPPVVVAARLLRIPRVILEPNAYPGKANILLGPLADRIFVAFEAAARHFDRSKVRVFGTPIRKAFLERKPDRRPSRETTLLVFGGSRGAHAVNAAMVEGLPTLSRIQEAGRRMKIIHQTGDADYDDVKKAYATAGLDAEVIPFLFDMPSVLGEADLVVSRAGAMTLAELTACGKAAVLIPFPHAIYDHQMHNAKVLESAGAAVVILQRDLSGSRLAEVVGTLLRDPDRLSAMGERSRSLGRTDSSTLIVRECVGLLKRKNAGP
jgi:UDP-N-acetylglucosamine--N-acetylmuramyl-(pentapeptide) pyrophosphoryl-undecaprenol N-acetylglucosamine transferase